MILAKATSVPDSSIIKSWNNLKQKQIALMGGDTAIKHFNSYSHILYWLMRNGRFNSPLCGQMTKITVLNITVIIIHSDSNTHKIAIKGCGGCGKICILKKFDLCDLLVGENKTLGEKGLCFGVDPESIINYVGVKLAIQNHISSTENPSEFMKRSNHGLFLRGVLKKVCNLNKYLNPYTEYHTFFK